MKWLLMILFSMCAGHLVSGETAPNPSVGELDGKIFSVSFKRLKYNLVFKKGALSVKFFDKLGFKPSKYKTKVLKAGIEFKSTFKSKLNGEIKWQGIVTGDKVKGSFAWTSKSNVTENKTYTGKLITK